MDAGKRLREVGCFYLLVVGHGEGCRVDRLENKLEEEVGWGRGRQVCARWEEVVRRQGWGGGRKCESRQRNLYLKCPLAALPPAKGGKKKKKITK